MWPEKARFEPSESLLGGWEVRGAGQEAGEARRDGDHLGRPGALGRAATEPTGAGRKESADWSVERLLEWRPAAAGTTACQQPWQGESPADGGWGRLGAQARSREGLCSQALRQSGDSHRRRRVRRALLGCAGTRRLMARSGAGSGAEAGRGRLSGAQLTRSADRQSDPSAQIQMNSELVGALLEVLVLISSKFTENQMPLR